jgi:hypothetical protein
LFTDFSSEFDASKCNGVFFAFGWGEGFLPPPPPPLLLMLLLLLLVSAMKPRYDMFVPMFASV